MEFKEDKLLKVWPETATYLGTSRSHAYGLVNSGVIPSVRLGRSVRVPFKALLAYIERNTRGGETEGLAFGSAHPGDPSVVTGRRGRTRGEGTGR